MLFSLCLDASEIRKPSSGAGGGAGTGESYIVAGSLSATLTAERLFGCDAQDLACADPGANGTFAIAFLRSATLAGNPALASGECTFSTTGLICEGSTADDFEVLLTFTDPASDKTITFPDLTGTVFLDTSALGGDLSGTPGAAIVADDSHAHTGTSLSGIDISSDTNLSATAPAVLSGDTIQISQNAGTDITADLEEEGVTCTDCIGTGEVQFNYLASLATTAPVTGGAAGSEGAALTIGLNQNAGTDITADLEEEAQIRGTAIADNAADTEILVGDAASSAKWVPSSGDVTVGNTGAFTIGASKISESMLKVVDSPSDEDVLTFESTTGDFEWLTPNAGTDFTADLEEEAHATEHSLGGADAITVTNLASSCTDAQVLGGTAAGTGVECQAAAGGSNLNGYFFGISLRSPEAAVSIAALAAANAVHCHQFVLPVPHNVGRITLEISTLSVGGLADFGLYDPSGTKVISTGAQSTTSTGIITVDVADTTVAAGAYFNCWTTDNTTARVRGFNSAATAVDLLNAQAVEKVGRATNDSASGVLPATLGSPIIGTADNSNRNTPMILYEP